jgi:hypothetical protein
MQGAIAESTQRNSLTKKFKRLARISHRTGQGADFTWGVDSEPTECRLAGWVYVNVRVFDAGLMRRVADGQRLFKAQAKRPLHGVNQRHH